MGCHCKEHEKKKELLPVAPSDLVGLVDYAPAAIVSRTVASAGSRMAGESQRSFGSRLRSQERVMRRTEGQFRKTGVALRQAVNLLGRQIGVAH